MLADHPIVCSVGIDRECDWRSCWPVVDSDSWVNPTDQLLQQSRIYL